LLTEMGDYLMKHGDAVKDIAFNVEDCRALFKVYFVYCIMDICHVCIFWVFIM